MVTILVLVGAIILLLLVSLGLQKRSKRPTALPRKILHIGAISICAASVYLIEDPFWIFLAVIFALPLLATAVGLGLLRDPVTARRSWGIFYFALVFALLIWLFGEDAPALVFYPMAILAWADGLATLVGERYGLRNYELGGDRRSWIGSLTFLISALTILFFGHSAIPEESLVAVYGFEMLIFLAVFLTLTEAISAKGRDNLWLPLATAYWLLIGSSIPGQTWFLFVIVVISSTLTWGVYKMKWLNAGGAATACLMAWVMLLSPQPEYFVFALLFFALGSLFSLLPKKGQPIVRIELSGRSKAQVLANGGAPLVFLMLHFYSGHQFFLMGFVAGFAAALSDTASSEIGSRMSQRAYAIIGFKPLERGVSGGVSALGTFAGLLFAAILPLIAWDFDLVGSHGFIALTAIAFSANLLDSVLGQFFQSKQMLANGAWQDAETLDEGLKTKGLRWMNNDVVNAFSTTFATLSTALVWWLA